jgi:urease accessory protein
MKLHRALAVFALAVLAPASAEAHLVSSGMGPLYDGISHFGLSPEDFLPVIALAFLAGLRGPTHARLTLAVLPLAWLVGGLFALSGVALSALTLPIATALLFLAIGALLAADAKVAPPICAGVAACLGLIRGAGDLAGVAISGAHILTLLGMAASVFAVFALAASVTLPLQRLWMIVAARVSGSWLAALGLLFAGWILRYGARVQ